MRILASNPDTLGDLVLRQPLYAALLAAGHELTLVVRPGLRALVPYVAPGANVLELPYEPYAHDVAEKWDLFAPLFDRARDANPDLLLIAPYRWTAVDERLSAELPAPVRRVGMSGHLFAGDPAAGAAPASGMRFGAVAEVREDQPEVEKNAALAAAVSGVPLVDATPRLAPTDAAIDRAREWLSRAGLAEREYWIVCVTGTAHVSLKTWPAEKWAEFLQAWAADRPDRRFVFIGLPSERADVEAVRWRLPAELASRTVVHTGPGTAIDDLIALTALSSGYVGHDTGPMHVAAALGKPVLGVFGGGTWPRFVPAVEPSVSVMVHVPCVGCGWWCAFATSHCIKQVPVDEVLRAARDLDAGRVSGR